MYPQDPGVRGVGEEAASLWGITLLGRGITNTIRVLKFSAGHTVIKRLLSSFGGCVWFPLGPREMWGCTFGSHIHSNSLVPRGGTAQPQRHL